MKIYAFQARFPNGFNYGENVKVPDDASENYIQNMLNEWILNTVQSNFYFQYDELEEDEQ